MEFNTQKNIIDKLKEYDYLANDNDYISVSEWANGDGYDIDINGEQLVRLTIGELDAINYLTKTIQYKKEKFSIK